MPLKKAGHENLRRQLTLEKLARRDPGMPSLGLGDEHLKIAVDVFTKTRTEVAQDGVIEDLLAQQSAIGIAVLRLSGDLKGDDLILLRREIDLDPVCGAACRLCNPGDLIPHLRSVIADDDRQHRERKERGDDEQHRHDGGPCAFWSHSPDASAFAYGSCGHVFPNAAICLPPLKIREYFLTDGPERPARISAPQVGKTNPSSPQWPECSHPGYRLRRRVRRALRRAQNGRPTKTALPVEGRGCRFHG